MRSKRMTPTSRHALPRVVFVVGPTSSGKTALGLRLAKLLNGEIINADARQVYRDVSIGTGKPPGKRLKKGHRGMYLVEGIPHYLMDFLPPDRTYTVAEWRESAMKAIHGIIRRKKLPIVVGGTGLYVSALIDNYQFPGVEPQPAMRAAFESKSLEELVRALLTADPGAADVVDLKNKRRVIRAFEVVTFSGLKFSEARGKAEPLVHSLLVGIQRPPEELYARLGQTIDEMMAHGLVDEVRTLLHKGISPDAPAMTSIGYTDIARYLRGELSLEAVTTLIKLRTRQYTKRQITWFKRDKRIHWAKDEDQAVRLVKRGLFKKESAH
jgi:tRNA dimethylallyltransferase